MFEYTDVYPKLSTDTAIVTFLKKDSTIRVMLCTRNLMTASLKHGNLVEELGGHDKRCNIHNGNVAVIDLVLGEARSFAIDRLIDIKYYGQIETAEQFDKAVNDFIAYRDKYEASYGKSLQMDTFNGGASNV